MLLFVSVKEEEEPRVIEAWFVAACYMRGVFPGPVESSASAD